MQGPFPQSIYLFIYLFAYILIKFDQPFHFKNKLQLIILLIFN